ncbi:MAG: hypothetical protein P8X77_16380 [Maritimibacter sp.]
MKHALFLTSLAAASMSFGPALAEDADTLPACAQTGASSVFMNGKPALKMGDVINCPPELIEIVPGVMIEGQPMVHLRSGKGDKGACATRGSSDITVAGKQAQRAGDATCIEDE